MMQSAMELPLHRLILIFAMLSAVLVVGMVGFHLIEGWNYFDGFYMTLMTLSTVGYGEVHPLGLGGRIWASFLMLTGVSIFLLSFGLIGDLLIRLELADYFGNRRRHRMLEKLSDHYIVCGAGRVGRSVIRELRRSGAGVVLIDNEAARCKWAVEQNIPTITADATQDDTLRLAKIHKAKGLVAAIGNDAQNVYVTLSARVLNADILISARATDEQSEQKLRRAGATTVLTPYTFIGHRLAQSMLRPHVLNFLDVASAFSGNTDLDLVTEQIQLAPASGLAGKTLQASAIRQSYGVIVLAIQRAGGATVFNPGGDTIVEANDVVIAMGESAQLKKMEADFRK